MTLNNSSVFNDLQTDLAKIAASLQGFEAALLTQQRTRFTREMLALAPSLKLISQAGPGTTHIDVAACTGHGVLVSAGGIEIAGLPAQRLANAAGLIGEILAIDRG